MGDLVFPATDAGVLAQVIGLLLVAGLLLWVVRRSIDLVWFVSGLAVLVAGLMALRTVH